ncbi:DUF881 domain-containing protein [Schaalia canis]|uniref:DUF881 domain-containing protein n=1 Tax=Schaalia canis TaxID=100469 RepID=A0A3P1SFX2_9ACTO|nr:DUF881 domain-containing protein [Schaalia canis]RRC96191.1 DUF881 domain-containing protein [Schaalia canis]
MNATIPDGQQEPMRPQRDPAASMSLLTQILFNPLDAGYHSYGAAKSSMTAAQKVLVVILAVALGFVSMTAVKNLRAPTRFDIEASLLTQVHERTEIVNTLDKENEQINAKISAETQSLTPGSDELPDGTALATAQKTVHGKGLRVTLNDAPQTAIETSSPRSTGKVRDHDLRMVVNALWSAGAEAMSINGIRLGPGSFIRTAGSSVLVNVKPVHAPYIVEAIGDPTELSVSLVRGASGDYLSSVESLQGIQIVTQSVEELTMEGRDARPLRHTTPVNELRSH